MKTNNIKVTILVFALIIASAWFANAMYLVMFTSIIASVVISIQLDKLSNKQKVNKK